MPGPEEQIKAPPLPPQPELFRLPVSVVVNPLGALNSVSPLMLLLAVNPRFTPVIRSFVSPTPETLLIVRLAEPVPMSKLYVAAGHPGSVPQFPRVRVPIVSALAGVAKARARASNPKVDRSFVMTSFVMAPNRDVNTPNTEICAS